MLWIAPTPYQTLNRNNFPITVSFSLEEPKNFSLIRVLAGKPGEFGEVIGEIEKATGYPVYNMPKLEEFYVGLRFEA